MLLDKQNLFSDAQTVTATAYSTNTLRLGKGNVSYVPIIIQVIQDFAGLTNIVIDVETSATSNFSSSTTVATLSAGVASLKAGYQYKLGFLPKGNLGYMRLKYTVTGEGTAGKITAGVVAASDFSYQDEPSST